MDKNRQRDYARRVSQANRTELVVVTYEIIIPKMESNPFIVPAGRYGIIVT